jgi:DNA-binding CsgD family transcriptional regulator
VCRSLAISDLLDMRSVSSDRLAETLDGLASPVFLVDAGGRVVHRNEAAERLLAQGGMVAVRQGRLSVAGPGGRALAETLGRILAGEDALPDLPHTQPLGDPALGPALLATVLPLGRRDATDRVRRPWAAAAAVFMHTPDTAPLGAALAAFAALYGLTPAETRVVAALAQGGGLPEAAAALGVAPSTARSHLNSVFAKAKVSSQAELARRVMACASPLRA